MPLVRPLKRSFLAVAILTLIFASGCTSRLKKGQNMLVEKNYSEALQIFEELVAKDPKNEEAILGLRQARTGVIDQNLIKVRLLRMGSNADESLEMLKTIFDQQNKWQVFPTGPVAFTQKEEVGYAFATLKRELRATLDQKRALRASFLAQRYSFMFDERQKNEIQIYKAEAEVQGQKICKDERKTQNQASPFWSAFVDKICSYYRVARTTKEKPQKWNFNLYRNLETQFAENKVDFENPERISETVVKSFQSTAWYDPESTKALKASLRAQYRFAHSQIPRTLTHFYTVKVPYTVYQTQQVMNPATNQLEQKSVPQTAYREESRSLNYQATEHSLSTEINIVSEIAGSDFNLDFPFNKTESGGGIESFTENREIHLAKQNPNNIHPSSYFYAKFLRDYSEDSKKKLIEKYVQLFCAPIANQSERILKSEYSLKCLRQTKATPPAAASQWSRETYSLEVAQLDELLNL